jgi:hypothetical protein
VLILYAQFITEIRGNSKCSNFVHEFLDIIQNDMLVIEVRSSKRSDINGSTNRQKDAKRIECDKLITKLQTIIDKGEQYYTEGSPRKLGGKRAFRDRVCSIVRRPKKGFACNAMVSLQ